MKLSKTIWQNSAGDKNRNFVDLLLYWDVIQNGPGSEGSWPDCIKRLKDKGVSSRKITDLKRFHEAASEGDIVVLRVGTSEIYGVGEIVGSALWLDDFGDIDGWDIQFIRRVRWLWDISDNNGKPKDFAIHTLKMGDTFQKLTSSEVINWLKDLDISAEKYERRLKELPKSDLDKDGRVIRLENKEIADYLFDKGISAGYIDLLLNQIDDIIRIAEWYQRSEQEISEHETVAYLVIPLLRALGWTPQKMAIEWKSVDIALFDMMPREKDNIVIVVEAKKRGSSCLTAKPQAESYVDKLESQKCKRLIVTDGIRFGIYLRKSDGKFPDNPDAYFNLTRIVKLYPIIKECRGAKEAILFMAADWSE